MSVLVKDMLFPVECRDCEFSKPWGNSGTYCSRHPEKDDVKYGDGKPDWCPLGNVPTPHGRLIDADALLRDFPIRADHYDKEHGSEHFVYGVETVMDYVGGMPTIIEAEE